MVLGNRLEAFVTRQIDSPYLEALRNSDLARKIKNREVTRDDRLVRPQHREDSVPSRIAAGDNTRAADSLKD